MGIGAGLDCDVAGFLEKRFFFVVLDVDASGKVEVPAASMLSGWILQVTLGSTYILLGR